MSNEVQTVVIHIGRGKTGTTALQRYLSENREALLRRGVLYPAAAGGSSGIGHDTFGKAFITEVPWYMTAPQGAGEALEAMRNEIRGSRTANILICSEQLELANPDLVRGFFSEFHGRFRFKIVYVIRSHDELVESEYNQLVKMRGLTCSFRDYSRQDFDGNFLAKAVSWQTAFDDGSVHCPVYDAHSPNFHNILFSYLVEIADPPPQTKAPAVNTSVKFVSLTIARLLNSVEVERRGPLYDLIFRSLAAKDFPALYFNSDEAREFRETFADTNRAITGRFSGAEKADLGGRRYSDFERDAIRRQIEELRLDRF